VSQRFELHGVVDDQHRLNALVPDEIAPGPVKIIIEIPPGEEDERAWARAIGRIWEADWSDPREDIYSLEDGEPVDGPG
jgi:hypothetical protein